MKSVMKLRFTELGAISMALILLYFVAMLPFDIRAFEATTIGTIVHAGLAVPAVFAVFLILSVAIHSAASHRWGWFFFGTLIWPMSLVYWWRFIRPQLNNGAQQGVPADRPRPAGSGGG